MEPSRLLIREAFTLHPVNMAQYALGTKQSAIIFEMHTKVLTNWSIKKQRVRNEAFLFEMGLSYSK